MAKVSVNIILKDGVDQTTFVNDVTSNTEVDLKNQLISLPQMVVLSVEEDYINTLKSHSSISILELDEEVVPPLFSEPSTVSLTNKKCTTVTSLLESGTDYLSAPHWFSSDIKEQSDQKLGSLYYNPRKFDDVLSLDGINFSQKYTGQHVDIVIHDVYGATAALSNDINHADFKNPDNLSQTRCIKNNWPDLQSLSNRQLSSGGQTETYVNIVMGNGSMMSEHSVPCHSLAGGLVGGFAKRSNLYGIFATGVDSANEGRNAIKSWHENKSVNPATGQKNPTIVCEEFGSPHMEVKHSVKVNSIASVTDPTHGTENRPSGGWGSDLTPFVKRLLMPHQVLDPITNTWDWHILINNQDQKHEIGRAGITAEWNAGIFVIASPHNHGGVFVNDDDPRHDGTYIDLDSGSNEFYDHYYEYRASGAITKTATLTTRFYPLRAWGTHGMSDKCFTICAGLPSESVRTVSGYSGRGPCIELVSIGNFMISATPSTSSATALQDGDKWGSFGGNSGAMPHVAGIAACYMEKHFVKNGVYPTPDQLRDTLLSEARFEVRDNTPSISDWSNVPVASDTQYTPLSTVYHSSGFHRLRNSDYDRMSSDLSGTSQKIVYYNDKEFNREQTYKERPTSGVLYPRPRKFDIPISDAPDLTPTS